MELGDDERTGQAIDPAGYTPRNLTSDLRSRGPLPLLECLKLGEDLAGALQALHRHGLAHRDIKPSNIIFFEGVPKLADIGLVTSVDAGTDGFFLTELPDALPGCAEYIPTTLRALIDLPGPIPAVIARTTAQALVEAMELLVRGQLAHERIRPDNVFFVRGEPRLGPPDLWVTTAPT